MQLFSGLVLVQVYLGNLLVVQLCKVLVESCSIAVGLCPVHCSLTFSFIFKHNVFNSPQGEP